jgi:hypothetical protein
MKVKMMKSIVSILFLGILLSGCRAPQDNLIVPGKRVGALMIGRTKGNDIGVDGRVADKYTDQGLGIGFDKNLRIASIHVTRPNYKTKEGLTVGDSEKAVQDAYGKGETVTIPILGGNQQKAVFSNNALHYPGIRWVIGNDGKVASILVSAE